jgi:hypothetical protein
MTMVAAKEVVGSNEPCPFSIFVGTKFTDQPEWDGFMMMKFQSAIHSRHLDMEVHDVDHSCVTNSLFLVYGFISY